MVHNEKNESVHALFQVTEVITYYLCIILNQPANDYTELLTAFALHSPSVQLRFLSKTWAKFIFSKKLRHPFLFKNLLSPLSKEDWKEMLHLLFCGYKYLILQSQDSDMFCD